MSATTISPAAYLSTGTTLTNSVQNTTNDPPDVPVFSKLSSILFSQYIFVILGFLAGHFRVLSRAQIRGFGRFVHRYAISAVLLLVSSLTFNLRLR